MIIYFHNYRDKKDLKELMVNLETRDHLVSQEWQENLEKLERKETKYYTFNLIYTYVIILS